MWVWSSCRACCTCTGGDTAGSAHSPKAKYGFCTRVQMRSVPSAAVPGLVQECSSRVSRVLQDWQHRLWLACLTKQHPDIHGCRWAHSGPPSASSLTSAGVVALLSSACTTKLAVGCLLRVKWAPRTPRLTMLARRGGEATLTTTCKAHSGLEVSSWLPGCASHSRQGVQTSPAAAPLHMLRPARCVATGLRLALMQAP